MVYGLWFMVHAACLRVYGLWFMVHASCLRVYGLWFMLKGQGIIQFSCMRGQRDSKTGRLEVTEQRYILAPPVRTKYFYGTNGT